MLGNVADVIIFCYLKNNLFSFFKSHISTNYNIINNNDVICKPLELFKYIFCIAFVIIIFLLLQFPRLGVILCQIKNTKNTQCSIFKTFKSFP